MTDTKPIYIEELSSRNYRVVDVAATMRQLDEQESRRKMDAHATKAPRGK